MNNGPQIVETVIDSTNKKSRKGRWSQSACVHSKCDLPFSGIHRRDQFESYYRSNWGSADIGFQIKSQLNLSSYINFSKPDFQQNNSFELLPFLFDLDDTIAMAGKEYWKKLRRKPQSAYGAYTWAVAPLASDAKSLYNTATDIFGGLERSCSTKPFKRVCPITFQQRCVDSAAIYREFVGSLSITGYHSVSPPNNVLDALGVFADEIGFHPDLKTAWDILPLSFVIDYWLPMGDFLESLHPRSWFKPDQTFTGTGTLKGRWRQRVSEWKRDYDVYCSGKFYHRGIPISVTKSAQYAKPLEWSSPNWRQVFNTAYLAAQSRGSR